MSVQTIGIGRTLRGKTFCEGDFSVNREVASKNPVWCHGGGWQTFGGGATLFLFLSASLTLGLCVTQGQQITRPAVQQLTHPRQQLQVDSLHLALSILVKVTVTHP